MRNCRRPLRPRAGRAGPWATPPGRGETTFIYMYIISGCKMSLKWLQNAQIAPGDPRDPASPQPPGRAPRDPGPRRPRGGRGGEGGPSIAAVVEAG